MDNSVKAVNILSKSTWKKFTSMREFSVLMFVIGVCVIMTIVTPTFASQDTLVNVLYNISTSGILAIGMTAALISGGFDLSVGAVLGLTCTITAQLYLSSGLNVWLAAGLGMLIAIGIGAANGFFITKLGLSSFITTLAMLGIARGAVYVVSKGVTLSFTSADPAFLEIGKGKVGIIPNIGIILIILAIVFDILMRRSRMFRKVYYAGSNETAARMSGINSNRVKFYVYVFLGGLAGLCGILSLMRFSMAAPTLGTGTELTVISACVIGGCSLNGGQGTVLGAVLGVILLAIVSSAMTLLSVSIFWQQLVTSLILLIAVTMDSINERIKANRLMLDS
ncbi:MAG: ABC transporter permease [Clostridiales bacterium]|nr:ABC transporter permease [Clostridiales bacterium]